MTSINLAVQRKARAAFIISDGAITAPDGTLLKNVPKIVFGAGRFPWAAGVTGNVEPATVHKHVAAANPLNLKQLIRRLPDAMRAAVKDQAERLGWPEQDIMLKLVGAVWDFANKRPEGFLISSSDGTMAGQTTEPYAWYELPWAVGSYHADGLPGFLGREVDMTDPTSFDPEKDGLALVKAQRAAPSIEVTPRVESGHCRIGGDVDLTEVTKHGVKVWKIHEFGDRLGERIAV